MTDLGTVLALGGLFASFGALLAAFVAVSAAVLAVLPATTRFVIRRVGHRVSEPEIKFLLLVLFGLGALAAAAGSEAVLPAYVAGLVVAGIFLNDRVLIDRMRSSVPTRERTYLTLLMSTGLTFGSIAALFGLTHDLITQHQYSVLVTVVILSAFVPTLIAQQLFQPKLVDEEEQEALGAEDVSTIRGWRARRSRRGS